MKKTIPIAQVEEQVRGWTALVQVLHRSHMLVNEKDPTISCRRFVFVDLDGTEVSAVAYNENIPPSSMHLIPLKKYYVSGATLKKAAESDKIGPYQFTWTINNNTLIEPCEDGLVDQMFCPIEYQRFGNLQRFIDTEDLQNIQGLVAHTFEVKQIGLHTINRDIVFVNDERIPMILTLWNSYAANEGYQLASTITAGNVVLAMRVKVTTLHGLSLSTRAGTCILINPPTPEAAVLKQWYLQEKAVVADLVTTEAYKNTSVLLPLPHPEDIKTVTLITPNNEHGSKVHWLLAVSNNHCGLEHACNACKKLNCQSPLNFIAPLATKITKYYRGLGFQLPFGMEPVLLTQSPMGKMLRNSSKKRVYSCSVQIKSATEQAILQPEDTKFRSHPGHKCRETDRIYDDSLGCSPGPQDLCPEGVYASQPKFKIFSSDDFLRSCPGICFSNDGG
ncbi:Unknown protein [Striga hermonthica]|uniref:Replication protein A OB domain-containing protein n=1 Tax=Striga hermonthica TaxID=68872 RepID=A0A9N7R510_STRHE|nr:Unknown protein [Striga hermonthica]